MDDRTGGSGVRLAELIAALSLGVDLGLGQPMEHVLRECVLALRLGERFGLQEAQRPVVYYVSLLAWVGCHADSYEQARWFGDDVSARADVYDTDFAGLNKARFVVAHVGAGEPPARRALAALEFLASGREAVESMHGTHCLIAADLARRLGLGEPVREALLQVFERWDGKGDPGFCAAGQISLPVRLVQLADVVEVFHRRGGIDAAVAVARERSGTQFDPAVVECFCDAAGQLLAPLLDATSWDAVIDAQPDLRRTLADSELDAALEAIADFADLKSPYTMGHSRAVADLAAEAGRRCGLAPQEVRTLRRAGLVHDLGRLGVSNTIWDKRGPLTAVERERVRLHPYLTERILSSSAVLAPLGALAAQHHERLDGSGYPRGLRANALSPAARVLAAADVYHAMVEPRPHRAARSPLGAAQELRAEAREGRLDGEAVDAVLSAAGHEATRRAVRPAGLTAREVEILRLLARGLLNKEIARRLGIAPKTVGNHVEHIYAKIGVSSRAAAGLFATERGLLAAEQDIADRPQVGGPAATV
ncbi:MAG TPA: HD domain-containing phosphohydrolase [Solirubrobacteraceae bacterium]|nr:HD domain-containing phosphohydrolase [Solirubrobacteraceae bacterium]